MKYCPELTTIQWQKAMLRGNGDYQTVVLNECIREKCIAYKDGFCVKYQNSVTEEGSEAK